MYPAIKSNAISEEQAIILCGKEAVEKVKSINCEFTSRVLDECEEVTEMSASIGLEDGRELTILYLIDNNELNDCEDLGNLSYDNYTFTVN